MMTRFQPFAPFPFERKMDINGPRLAAATSAVVSARRYTHGGLEIRVYPRVYARKRIYERVSAVSPQSGTERRG